jgi:6-phosphofructokinase 2
MSRIVTCTANPAIDVSTVVDRVEPFRKLRCAEARRDPGGGGINVARVVRRLEGEATAIYPAGGPTGELLRRLMEREAIESIVVSIQGETREDFTVLEKESGREFRFVMPGPVLSAKEIEGLLSALSALEPCPVFVVVSGSLPAGIQAQSYSDLVGAAKAKGAQVVLDTSGPPLESALNEGVYLVKPNLREFRALMRAPLEGEREMVEAARRLIEAGRAQIVALTLGDRGALLVTRDEAWRGSTPKMTPVSTVGAGDSFLGAMVSSLAGGLGLADCLRHGIAAGAAALLSRGTDLCRKDDVDRLLSGVVVEELMREAS